MLVTTDIWYVQVCISACKLREIYSCGSRHIHAAITSRALEQLEPAGRGQTINHNLHAWAYRSTAAIATFNDTFI